MFRGYLAGEYVDKFVDASMEVRAQSLVYRASVLGVAPSRLARELGAGMPERSGHFIRRWKGTIKASRGASAYLH